MNIFSRVFLSFFGTGYSPVAPGTVGSAATIPLILLLGAIPSPVVPTVAIIIILTVISCYLAHRAQEQSNSHDPQWIVIDEVIGMLITWCFVLKTDLISLLVLFVLFRFFDIIKIWPASYFDKMKHGSGVILDDVVSGIFAGLAYLLLTLTPYLPT